MCKNVFRGHHCAMSIANKKEKETMESKGICEHLESKKGFKMCMINSHVKKIKGSMSVWI